MPLNTIHIKEAKTLLLHITTPCLPILSKPEKIWLLTHLHMFRNQILLVVDVQQACKPRPYTN